MKLAEAQAALWSAIVGGRSEGVERIVQPGRGLGAERRVEIYARMYFWRQVDALREDFPKLAILLGDDAFAHLVEAYLRAYPSEHPSLGRLGRALPAFLSDHRSQDSRPDLADLAALEWARAEVFVEADAPIAPPSLFSKLPPEQFAQARVQLVPAIRVLSLQHDAIGLWRTIENDRPVRDPIPQAKHALVWRKGWDVYHVTIEADEAAALQRAREGGTLAEICEAFGEREEPAAAAFAALQSWVTEAMVAGVVLVRQP